MVELITSQSGPEGDTCPEFQDRVANARGDREVGWTAVLDAIPKVLRVDDSCLRVRPRHRPKRDLFERELAEIHQGGSESVELRSANNAAT